MPLPAVADGRNGGHNAVHANNVRFVGGGNSDFGDSTTVSGVDLAPVASTLTCVQSNSALGNQTGLCLSSS